MNAALLTVTAMVGIIGCYLVAERASKAEFKVESGVLESEPARTFYTGAAPYMYALPVVVWIVGMVVTSAGERAPRVALALSGALLVFAVGWEVGSHFAL